MQVHIENDGPVTIPIDTPESLAEAKPRKPQKAPKQKPNKGKDSQDTDLNKDVEKVSEGIAQI